MCFPNRLKAELQTIRRSGLRIDPEFEQEQTEETEKRP